MKFWVRHLQVVGTGVELHRTWRDVFAHFDEVLEVVERRRTVVGVDDDHVDVQLSGHGRSTAVQCHHLHVVVGSLLAVHSTGQSEVELFRTTTDLRHLQ